jgi:hypothetical protein
MNVYIPYIPNYLVMRWPAPDGFHVPSRDEWVALCWILTTTFSMASNATTVGTYLKMPKAGWRSSSSSNVLDAGSTGYYWSSTPYTADSAYRLWFDLSSLSPNSGYSRTYGISVRCFKNTPVIPDSNWTTLYQGTWSAWVFRNSSLWLISVSWDGTTWYTIMDKNLWATTVYNQWDTVTDANCGYFYQWWNNYWFAHSGTITTSSTKVDASSYWPGNYYNSSTFITWSADWSSVQNDNLWGYEDSNKPSELYKAYIGEYTGRLPSAYQEVERIGTSWSQWIDTWFVISWVTWIQTETKIAVNTTSQNIPIFWSYSPNYNSSTPTSWKYYHLTPYSNKWYFWKNGSEWNGGSYSATVWKQYEIVYNNSSNYLNVDWSNVVSVSWTTWPTSPYTYTIAISRRGTARSWDVFYWRWNYYYFNIYNRNTNTYERQMIPCYRKSDNVIWMYDIVNWVFYTNNGSWTFTKWNDVD